MKRTPRPADEARRLVAVRDLGILDTEPEERFDRITRLAARLLDVPVAMLSFLDAERQWPKSVVGIPAEDLPRDLGFCSYTILSPGPEVVPDLTADPRFLDLPGVDGGPLRFYAGHPVRAPSGEPVATLCVLDYRPRSLDAAQLEQLRDLAGWAESELARSDSSDAAQRLRRSEGRLWTIVDSVGDGIVTFGDDGTIRFANRAAEAMLRTGPGELIGTPVSALLPGDEWRRVVPIGEPERPDGETVLGRRRTVTARRRDGEAFPIEVTISEARDVGDERILVAVGRDLTAQERAETALRRSEGRFRAMFDNTSVGVVLLDGTAGLALDVNRAFADLMGYPVQALLGQGFWAISHPDERQNDEELLLALQQGKLERLQREQRYLRGDGTAIWGRLNLSTMRKEDDDDPNVYAIGVFEDITRRRAAERMKDELVSVVGHELRTPLTSIRGSLGLLVGGVLGPLPDEASHMLALAVSNTDRLVRLINDMLDLERMDAGRMEIRPAPVAAEDVVTQALQSVQAAADAADVRLVPDVPDVLVSADADRIVQALVNLIGNAVKFSPAGAEVGVQVVEDRHHARFCVRDTGRGIPSEQLEAIFERFHQVDGSDAREKGGTGLGLPIARAIVERHGGRLWAENAGDGPGAMLCFTLPLARTATLLVCAGRGEEMLSELSHVVPALRPGTVLVVEDDPALGEVLARTFAHGGAPVRVVGTAEDAVRTIRSAPPAAIVLDLVLPDDDGFGIVEQLRGDGLLADVPVVVYTALDLGPAERERLQLGRVEFLAKTSASPSDVERRVAELLESA